MPYTDNTLILLPMFKKGHQRIIKEKDYDSIPVQECIPVGCAAVAVCWEGGCLLARGCLHPRGCLLLRGVSASGGGVYPSMQWGRPPPVDRMRDRCKNITFPQLRLRTVKIKLARPA